MNMVKTQWNESIQTLGNRKHSQFGVMMNRSNVIGDSRMLGPNGNPSMTHFAAPNRIVNFTEIIGLQWIDKYGQHWVVDEEGIPKRQSDMFVNDNNFAEPTIQQTCYCQQRMMRFDAYGRPCESCRKTTRHVMFACYNQCIFYDAFGTHFVICWDCYYAENDAKKDDDDKMEED